MQCGFAGGRRALCDCGCAEGVFPAFRGGRPAFSWSATSHPSKAMTASMLTEGAAMVASPVAAAVAAVAGVQAALVPAGAALWP